MATPRQSSARAGAVSRALRQAGFGVGYRDGRYNALEVSGYPGGAWISLDETSHRASIGDVADALTEAGYTVHVRAKDRRYPRLRSAIVRKEGWT